MNKTIVKGIIVVLVIICFGLALCDFLVSSKDISNNNSNSNSNTESNSNIESNSNSNVVEVTGIKISSSKQTIEEGGSFKLTAIVLPNEATNKNIRWTSSNEKIATVDNNGLVSAKKEGTTKINAITEDGNKSVSCTITVTKKKVSTIVKLDDIKDIAKEYNALTEDEVLDAYRQKYQDKDGNYINGMDEDKWLAILTKLDESKPERNAKKTKLLDKLYNENKTFIMLIKMDICVQDKYPLVDNTARVLDERNISYIKLDMGNDDGIYDSKIYSKNENVLSGKQILIIKDGKVYAKSDDYTSGFNSDSDVINWLSKYIDIK